MFVLFLGRVVPLRAIAPRGIPLGSTGKIGPAGRRKPVKAQRHSGEEQMQASPLGRQLEVAGVTPWEATRSTALLHCSGS